MRHIKRWHIVHGLANWSLACRDPRGVGDPRGMEQGVHSGLRDKQV